MKKAIVYIHGKGGNADEAQRYVPLFPGYTVLGYDYASDTPWEAQKEFYPYFEKLCRKYSSVSIIANSIGAFFTLNSIGTLPIERAYFISPVVDMEALIKNMLLWAGASEEELMKMGSIETQFGETLSRDYLLWVREHPVEWNIPTEILYGSGDSMQSSETLKSFAKKHNAGLTVMEGGEHWFHTREQTAFLDKWITDIAKQESIEEILRNTTEQNQHKVDWTKAWSGKYPVLKSYRDEVDIPRYAAEIRRLFNELEDSYGYSELDAMLVLKDILAHEYMDNRKSKK